MKNVIFVVLIFVAIMGCNSDKTSTQSNLNTDLGSADMKEVHKISYSAGYKYAQAIKEMKLDAASQEYFIAGVKDFFKDQNADTPKLVGEYARQIDKIIMENRNKYADQAKIDGEKFATEILNLGEYKKSSDGLIYKIIKGGTEAAKIGNETHVQFNYEAKKITGEKFETTMNGDPRITPYTGLLKAWQEALKIAGPNSQIEIIAPPSLTYGDRGALPRIKPGEYLIYSMNFYNVYKNNPRNK